MDNNLPLWFCYADLLVFNPVKNHSQWNSIYCSIPAKSSDDLKGFSNEFLKVITVLDWHPFNRCAIAENDFLEVEGRCPDILGKPY